jgi:hypothetical protein
MKTIFGLTLMMLLVACQPNDLSERVMGKPSLAQHILKNLVVIGKCKWVLRVMEFLPVLVLPVI